MKDENIDVQIQNVYKHFCIYRMREREQKDK